MSERSKMKPIRTEYSNITYTAEGCDDLPATRCVSPSGKEEVEVCLELIDEEVEQVIRNKKVYLYIMGRSVLNDPPKMVYRSTMAITAGFLGSCGIFYGDAGIL